MFSINLSIFNISMLLSSISILSLLLPLLLQVIERANVLSKIYDISRSTNFRYLLHSKKNYFFICIFIL